MVERNLGTSEETPSDLEAIIEEVGQFAMTRRAHTLNLENLVISSIETDSKQKSTLDPRTSSKNPDES